jgi:acyl carrier protein
MLDLDAGIEADLGIDSIKRVEILTALQKLGTPAQQQSVQGIMNKLTSARTLREIADLIAGVRAGPVLTGPRPSGSGPPPAAPFPPATTTSPSWSKSPANAPATNPTCSTWMPASKPTWASTPSNASKS